MADRVITLAFYKGHAKNRYHRAQDALIRFATGGVYSHVEMIEGVAALETTALCLSSSARDGGVREARIFLKAAHWDLVPCVLSDPLHGVECIQAYLGAAYDYPALLFSHVLAMGGHSKDKWFCSEICAHALGLDAPHRISPQMLYDIVMWRNRRTPATDGISSLDW